MGCTARCAKKRNVARGRLADDAGQPVHLTAVPVSHRIRAAGPASRSLFRTSELATRLSYFLWAIDARRRIGMLAVGRQTDRSGSPQGPNGPDAEGRQNPRAGDRIRHAMATRPGYREQSREERKAVSHLRRLAAREALFEESALFFQIRRCKPIGSVLEIFDADYTFVNETLAKHYGIPGVEGPEWRKIDGVKKYGRGGVLGLASVLAAQSGASRTSPVLRGNWLVETLLGEKIPKPPANVPRLPDEETGGDNLTVRQMVEKHAHVAECAVCHERIDPFGFALEKYDAIGRLREIDLAGRPIATDATLKDGTEFDGLDGLRKYLVEKRKDMMLRHFCTKLVGYALGRTREPFRSPR